MRLADLLAASPEVARDASTRDIEGGAGEIDITAVVHDSRAVEPGALFCCLPGAHHDGHEFAGTARQAGAAALVCERPTGVGLAEVVVPDARVAMAHLAGAFHDHPSRSLAVVGVTGTNGKTTTAHLLAWVLERAGLATDVIGTLTGTRTTPEATTLQARLAAHRDRGGDAVVMEVSSHALALRRVEGTRFAAVGFTNLSRDHLDFHPSLEAYFKAKASLFSARFAPVAVIDTDSPHGRLLADTSDVARVVRTGASRVEPVEVGVHSCRFGWRGQQVEVPLGGRFNVSNAVLAAELALALGLAPEQVVGALAEAPPVPGRFEQIASSGGVTVVVDYAHTPDALEKLLEAAREVAPQGRVVVVFGCGGDRDATKRPLMGRVAEHLADLVAITSDNPRGEPPEQILREVAAGFRSRPWMVEADRRRAIFAAVEAARPGDVVVIAGKGHEPTQEIGDRVEPFDDREVARQAVAEVGLR